MFREEGRLLASCPCLGMSHDSHILSQMAKLTPESRTDVFWDEAQLVYERLCARESQGIVWDLVALMAWIDLARLAVYGMLGIIWSRVWRGDGGGSVLVNASLMYQSTGQIRNSPQAVEI